MLDPPFLPGQTSAVERGPWHYGADYIAVYFEGDPGSLGALLPKGFSVEEGPCVAYVCDIVSVGENGSGMVASRPDRTAYREAALGIRCSLRGIKGIFYPVMWVTTEWSLLRGILNGYQKRLADAIFMTRLHPLNPGLRPASPGMDFSGVCVKGPETTLALKVTLEREGTASDLQAFGPTFGVRTFPRTDPSQGSVDEPVEILKSNSRVSDIWIGSGAISSSVGLGKLKVVSGAVYRAGFTISGSRVVR